MGFLSIKIFTINQSGRKKRGKRVVAKMAIIKKLGWGKTAWDLCHVRLSQDHEEEDFQRLWI